MSYTQVPTSDLLSLDGAYDGAYAEPPSIPQDTSSSTSSSHVASLPAAAALPQRPISGNMSVASSQMGVGQPKWDVPTYTVNAGLDFKLEVELPDCLTGVLTQKEWEEFAERCNQSFKKYRHTKADFLMLVSGPALLPLVPFIKRHNKKQRKVMLLSKRLATEFNDEFGPRGINLKYDRVHQHLYFTRC